MKVMGIDPGTATTGYSIMEQLGGKKSLLTYGVILTPPALHMAQRLKLIHEKTKDLIEVYTPEMMAIEQIFFHKNNKTVITVAQSRGVLIMTAALAGLDVYEYTPLQVKQAVVGYGGADKKQVQFMVQHILHLNEIPKPDDAADAIAIALCHMHSARLNAYTKGGK